MSKKTHSSCPPGTNGGRGDGLLSKLDPLGIRESEYLDELHPENYGFNKEDYDKQIYLDGVLNKQYSNIKEILSILRKTYCGSIGYEYMHI